MLQSATEVEFASAFELDESVRRLRDALGRASPGAPGAGSLSGKVSDRGVRLQRLHPWLQNSFKPYFRGEFVDAADGVVLRGRFGMHVLIKLFLGFWFGGLLWMPVRHFSATGWPHGDGWLLLLPFAALGAIGVGLVRLGVWLARKDVSWMSIAIRSALARPDPGTGSAGRSASNWRSRQLARRRAGAAWSPPRRRRAARAVLPSRPSRAGSKSRSPGGTPCRGDRRNETS